MKQVTSKYFFSVEGQTEQRYLDWLEKTINKTEEKLCRVKFDVKVKKNPLTRVKSMNILDNKIEIVHLIDYESQLDEHPDNFEEILRQMKQAEKEKGVKYCLGYSNFTFELWMILHKIDCNSSLSDRKKYLSYLNKAYQEKFMSLKEYKREEHFNRLLGKLTLEDVFDAIRRSKRIMEMNRQNGYLLQRYHGFEYYKENPSLSLWKPIEKVLKDCGIKTNELE